MSDDLQSEIQLLELSLDDLFSSPVVVEVGPVVEAKVAPVKKARRGRPKSTGPKACRYCGEADQDKLVSYFSSRTQKVCVRTECKPCFNALQAKRLDDNPDIRQYRCRKQSAKRGKDRKNNVKIERFIFTDCKASDKKFGREFDLTKEYIKEQIAKGCQFCGETTIRMTMDRIDNSIGHIKTNVVPACIRCNYVRRDMPYKAWLKVAKAMQTAREAGDFGDWTCEIMRGTRKLRKVQKGAKAA